MPKQMIHVPFGIIALYGNADQPHIVPRNQGDFDSMFIIQMRLERDEISRSVRLERDGGQLGESTIRWGVKRGKSS
jgi:hypothetical protein